MLPIVILYTYTHHHSELPSQRLVTFAALKKTVPRTIPGMHPSKMNYSNYRLVLITSHIFWGLRWIYVKAITDFCRQRTNLTGITSSKLASLSVNSLTSESYAI